MFVYTYGKTYSWQGAEAIPAALKERVQSAGLKRPVRVSYAGSTKRA